MFQVLSDRLAAVFQKLRSRGVLSEQDVVAALREVRTALLEADVNFHVVKDFTEAVKARAVGQEVLGSLTPGQAVVKVVHEEMVRILGGATARLALAPNPPTVIMMVGLQGSGKTTTAAKIARLFAADGRRVSLVAADTQRPAAIDQLAVLAGQAGCAFYGTTPGDDPVRIAEEGVRRGSAQLADAVIVDTAGRLQMDEQLMDELGRVRAAIRPKEILFVADGMAGQEAVNVARRFDERIGLTGIVLTKMDGDARGGAALSIRAVTGKPIVYIGTGEKLDGIEPFHPERIASRILGMGDVLTLIEKAGQAVTQEEAVALARKIKGDGLTLEDFRDQIRKVRSMGSVSELLGMIPGVSRLTKGMAPDIDDRELVKVTAIVDSMTPAERRNPAILNGSRRARVARGSGTTPADVNRLLKQFAEARKMMKTLTAGRFARRLAGGGR
ncbi:MAG: signal recognition particle protein [Nitrospirae bacterium RBG_16_64_22]|nr:MAG: signal recognition particle protein [Nitrospirae bacterium RBG_16_64_22]